MNDNNLIAQIRSKVDIVDVISSYLPLSQKGKNFFGVCPFHDDNNPSMSVSRELQIYRCFSCGASGNVFNFVMNYEHISFKEALNMLAEQAGVSVKGLNLKETPNKYSSFYEIYNLANILYQNNLNTSLGKSAKAYLKKRQITDDMIKEFGIGLSLLEQNQLTNILTQKNYDLKILNQLGLASGTKDTYINRIMFPLHDLNGKIVGFSGRIYDDSKLNKYLNTKETPIFKKGQLLYNYHVAKEEARSKHSIIVMEGFMDVIRASTASVRNIVALMGTAMTTEQANLIKRLSNQIILCFDGDEAGRHATLVNGEVFVKMGLMPKVIELENGDDPDTFILENGPDKFLSLIENAINFSDYKIKSLKKGVNMNSDEELANYINNVLKEASRIDDEIRQEIMLKNLAKETNISYNTLEKRLQEIIDKTKEVTPKTISLPKEIDEKKKSNKYEIASFAVLYYMLKNDRIRTIYERDGIFFPEEKTRVLANEISYYARKYGIIKIADFFTYLNDKKELVDVFSKILSLELDDNLTETEILEYVRVLREYSVNLEIKRLQELIKKENDPLEKAKVAEKIRKLKMGVDNNGN